MPFQPTYPKPYNVGVDVTNEEGISFECTIDDYDTINDAELHLRDINSGEELLIIKSNPNNSYKELEDFTISNLNGFEMKPNSTYYVEFELPNIPYIYYLTKAGDFVLARAGTPVYKYDFDKKEHKLYNGNGTNWAQIIIDHKTVYYLDVVFENGIPIPKFKDENSGSEIVSKINGGELVYTMSPYHLGGLQKQLTFSWRAYSSAYSYYYTKHYNRLEFFVTNPLINGPFPQDYFTEVLVGYRNVNSRNAIEYQRKRLSFSEDGGKLKGTNLFELEDGYGFCFDESQGGFNPLINPRTYTPLCIVWGNTSSSLDDYPLILNPGIGYTPNSDVYGSYVQTSFISGGGTSYNIVRYTGAVGHTDEKGRIVEIIRESGLPANTFFFDLPNAPLAKFTTDDSGSVENIEFLNNIKGYLFPPKVGKIYEEGNEDSAQNIEVKATLLSNDYLYSTDGGVSFLEGRGEIELPDFPLVGGRGDESRLLFALGQSFLSSELEGKKFFELLENKQISWYLRLYGTKEDVFVYAGENFQKKSVQGYGNLAILPNNSSISEGSTIFKNNKNLLNYSRLIQVENNFCGLNISSVSSIASTELSETTDVDTAVYKTYYTITLKEPISYPNTPYILSTEEGISVYSGMKCQINGINYEVSEDKTLYNKEEAITIHGFKFNDKGQITEITLAPFETNELGDATGVILENMRVEVFRDKCIAQLENADFELQSYDTYSIWSNSILTQQYYFETNNGQACSITSETPKTETEDKWTFNSCNVEFNGAYTGDLLWHKWELYKATDEINYELIKDTGEIYSTDLSVDYEGLDAGVEYKVKLIVSNNLSQVIEEEKRFKITAKAIVGKGEGNLFIAEFLEKILGDNVFLEGNSYLSDGQWEFTCGHYNNVFTKIVDDSDPTYDKFEQESQICCIYSSSEEILRYKVQSIEEKDSAKIITLCFANEVTIAAFGELMGPDKVWRIVFKYPDTVPNLGEVVSGVNYYLDTIEPIEDHSIIKTTFDNFSAKINCDSNSLQIDLSFNDFLFDGDRAFNLSKILLLKKNTITNEPIEEISISKECKVIYDYALANNNDYYYTLKRIYRVFDIKEGEDWQDNSNYIFNGQYAYYSSDYRIYVSSSGLSEQEVVGDYEGEYQFLKYHWNKIVILDTEKRLSEDIEDGLYYISKEPYSKWDFQLNLGDADVSINTDSGTFEGLYQFPRINETYRNYKTQSLSCGLGKIDNSTNWRYGRSSVNLANEWQKFCNNGHIKILRDQYGNLLPVKVTAKSYKCNNTKPMIMDISFDWTQVGPEENLIAIETSDEEVSN